MTEIKTRQIEVPVITKTVTQYACPICGKWYESEKQALECYERGTEETHKYAVGDVILVGHHPGDYYVREYYIVKELVWDKSDGFYGEFTKTPRCHDAEPSYHCEGQRSDESFMQRQVERLHMTAEEHETMRERAYGASPRGKVKWSTKHGRYEATISF